MPVQAELILLDSAAHPVESHVKDLEAFPPHFSGEDAVGGRAVGIDWGRRLRVAHLGEGCGDGNGLVAVEKNRYSFCFRGGSHDGADGLTFGNYWTIRGRSAVDVV